ncbi:MAG TPA: hypothetical protein PKD90_19905, partial [Phnomibacter sp.]|nr:hypothetical protein [Phnomibacter sp.]
MIEAFYWFKAGYCTAIEKLARRGGAWRKVQFAAAVGLFKHSQLGNILFDTRYALRYYTTTQKMPA